MSFHAPCHIPTLAIHVHWGGVITQTLLVCIMIVYLDNPYEHVIIRPQY